MRERLYIVVSAIYPKLSTTAMIVDFWNSEIFKIRSYHPSDLTSIYRICLLTAKSGSDASDIFKDHDLVGHYSAAPYATLEPELTFVVTYNNNVCGYILGTKNKKKFR